MAKSLLFQKSFLLLVLFSCLSSSPTKSVSKSYSEIYLSKLKDSELLVKDLELKVYLALSDEEQMHGLSSIKPEFFHDHHSMLFFNEDKTQRSFWMPDTYFNLDIFFLDADLKVLNVERNVPHHPGRSESPPIYRTGTYLCHHVFEMKHSKVSKKILIGDQLLWKNPKDHSQIKSSARLQK